MHSGHQNLILQRVNAEAWYLLGGVQWLGTPKAVGMGLIPGWGTKILHATRHAPPSKSFTKACFFH